MDFKPQAIPDVIVIEPKVFEDERGFFYESYREALFRENGVKEHFVQDNHTRSSKGVLRGLHYQIEPMEQAKLIRVICGKIFDVVVDIRKGSKTFGQSVSVTLDADKKQMIYIPAGFAHGYCTLEDGCEVLYKVSNFYSPEHERGILWSDPSLKIEWPKLSGGTILSKKDKKYPTLQEAFSR